MAKDDKKISWRSINNSLDTLDSQMKGIHKDTYFSDKSDKLSLDQISGDIMKSIDNIISNNSDVQGVPGISRLYSRISKTQSKNVGEFSDDIFSVFQDKQMVNSLTDTFAQTRSIKQLNDQIDTICKYMPKLEDAINLKKDNVLSADCFTKDFLNMISGLSNDDHIFSMRAETIKDKYNIQDVFDEMDYRAFKYGEAFYYCVPYKRALKELLKRKNNQMNMQTPIFRNESGLLLNETVLENVRECVSEGCNVTIPLIESGDTILEDGSIRNGVYSNGTFVYDGVSSSDLSDGVECKCNIELTISAGLLESVVESYQVAENRKQIVPKSIYEQYLTEQTSITEATKTQEFDKILPDEFQYDEKKDSAASDGFIDKNKDRDAKLTVPGCVTKFLDNDKILPIYIEDLCLGYWYIICQQKEYIDSTSLMKSGTMNSAGNMDNKEKDDKLLKYIARSISKNIDATFINSNTDLSKEIYMILKYDEHFNTNANLKVNATFIPAEDIHHHFYKQDPVTHRGISDLYKSIIPATIWCLITQCTANGILTRGQDRRVYYVQQTGVDTNVAQNLMNVVNQIKKGNFGVRQLESINNILGIVGKYNDFLIPVGPGGEPPIRFEIMQGQDINTPTDLLNTFEENAINATDVPLELISASKSLDYAIHYTMSNSRFISIVYKRQARDQETQSKIVSKLYNCEFDESISIKVLLPPPKILALTNTTQLIASTRDYVNNLVEIHAYDLDDEEKAEFTNLMMRHQLSTYLNIQTIDSLKNTAKINVASKKIDNGDQEQ